MAGDDRKQELRDQWDGMLQGIFKGTIPESAEWTDPHEIADVFNAISGSLNHSFHPGGGGEDINGAQVTREGNLEWSIHENGLETFANVVRPVKLTFWNPGKQSHEANFVLEVGALAPAGGSRDRSQLVEELTEVWPGVYEPLSSWENGESQNGDPLPQGARRLCRVVAPARFAIFGKGSLYNSFRDQGFDAYDAHHNDPLEFKKIVMSMAAIEL